jgi:hypothetical protein
MSNTDDAFGFPPYAAIEDFLHSRDHRNLRATERRIVAKALDGVPAVLLRNPPSGWWRELPAALMGNED